MALQKVDYVNQVTVITAENMNDIQDAIIALETAPSQGLSEEVKQALLQLAQKVAYIDDQGQTYYDDLYNALYPPKTVVSITAVFEQGTTVIYDDTALNDLKQYLTVTARYDDNTTAILPDASYTLSGTLEAGTSSVTVNYNGVVTSFDVVVTARPTLSSISAVYTQSGTVYDTDSLDSLKADLVVTAVYSDSSTQIVPAADYTLSGTLTAGTSTITVSYGGKNTTFSVTVTSYYNIWTWDYEDAEALHMRRIKRAATTAVISSDVLRPSCGADNGESNITRISFWVSIGRDGSEMVFENNTPITIDGETLYPIPVPDGATSFSVSITPSEQYCGVSRWTYDGNSQWTRNVNGSWVQGSLSDSLPTGTNRYITINCKANSAGNGKYNGTTVPYPTIRIEFS